MSLAKKLASNGIGTVAQGINTDDLEFSKASELIGDYSKKPIVLMGFMRYSTKKYGDAVAVVTNDGRGIYLPKRYVQRFDELDEMEIAEMMEGKTGIKAITTMETPNGDTVDIEFIDL